MRCKYQELRQGTNRTAALGRTTWPRSGLLVAGSVVLALLSHIGADSIINTLLMSVNERTREFGMMKAIGASGFDIGKLVMIETLFITVTGGVIGENRAASQPSPPDANAITLRLARY